MTEPTEDDTFKCRSCGEKYKHEFSSTEDVSLCRWCSGEELDERDNESDIDETQSHASFIIRTNLAWAQVM